VTDGSYRKFIKYFNIYNSNVRSHFVNLSIEVKAIQACYKDNSIPRNQIKKWTREIQDRLALWDKETRAFLGVLGRECRGRFFVKLLVKSRIKGMGKAISDGQKPLQS